MKFKEWLLAEMPLRKFQLVGRWNKDDLKRGYSAADIGILTNPKAVAKIHRQWQNSKQDYEFYFVRQPNAKKYLETGEVTSEWVKEKLNLDVESGTDCITVIFTNNIGAEKFPLTGWVAAHRFAHAIRRDKIFEDYFANEIERNFKNIINDLFPDQKGTYYARYDKKPDGFVEPFHLAMAVGTMKSVRDNNLRNFFEFTYELVAQYLTTGKIKFKPITKYLTLEKRFAWGRKNDKMRYSRISDDDLESINYNLEGMAETYEYYLDSILEGIVGKIYVM